MSPLNVRQRQALRYAVTKTECDREVRAAQALHHSSSSTPTLRYWFEDRGGWFIAMMLGFALVALSACGDFRPAGHPTSTLTLPDNGNHCVRGYRARQIGSEGAYGTPVVLVTNELCEPLK